MNNEREKNNSISSSEVLEKENLNLKSQLKNCKKEIDLFQRIMTVIYCYASPKHCGECRVAKYLAGNYSDYCKQIPETDDMHMLAEKARTDATRHADSNPWYL